MGLRNVVAGRVAAVTLAVVPVLAGCQTGSGQSPDCNTAIERHWPESRQVWAKRVVWRESRNIPTAANRRSSARGCFQLLQSLHGWRYTAVGCHPSQWSNADCNAKAALHLFQSAGVGPWRLA